MKYQYVADFWGILHLCDVGIGVLGGVEPNYHPSIFNTMPAEKSLS